MVSKLVSRRCADLASTTYIQIFKCKLLLPFTPSPCCEPFPSTVRQKNKQSELSENK